jgi:hypothetical protein
MHRDHEVQMARSQMYSSAQAAIEIHRLLRDISELEGLEGWVQSKLTLASEYLESVRDYLKYEAASQESEMMPFAEDAANYAVESIMSEEFAKQDVDDAVSKYIKSGGNIEKGKSSKGPRKPGMSMASKHIGGGGDKMKPSRTGRGSNPQGKAVVATEEDESITSFGGGVGGIIEPGKKRSFHFDENKRSVRESATGGSSSAGAVATSMSGPAHKPTSGVPND